MSKRTKQRNREKIFLPNGCWCSTPDVSPKNWQTKRADITKDWFIHYRFYDPNILDKSGKVKAYLVRFKGMNEIKSLSARQETCKKLLKTEISRLKLKGYNPYKQVFLPERRNDFEVNPDTPFITALWYAYERLECMPKTKYDIKSVVNGVAKAAEMLDISNLTIGEVSRKYYVRIFEKCRELNPKFSANRQNMYRAYLIKLYKILVEIEACEVIPLRDLEKKKVFKPRRKTTTLEERILIDEYLFKKKYRFWRFMHLFFSGGARETEMMRLQGKHVDLKNQIFTTITMKGFNHREVQHTIKTNVLHLWKEAMEGCGPEDFVFAYDLIPGITAVSADTVNKKWRKWVKEGLNIDADFYSLKHTHTSQVAKLSGEQIAADHNGHTSTAMVRTIYNYDRADQIHKAVKDLPNTLTGS